MGASSVRNAARREDEDLSVAAAVDKKASRGLPISVAAILSAAFLNLLGFTMAGPINPQLAAHFGLTAGSKVGALTAAYPFGMVFGLLLWPWVSDRRGMRQPVLVGSLAGVGCGLALQATCLELEWPLWSFLGLRALSGACAGASPVAKAFLADVATPDELPRWLAWREASATLAFIVGPSLGGFLYCATGSLGAVVGATSGGSLLAALVVALFATTPRTRHVRHHNDNVIPAGYDGSACPLGTRLLAAVATIVCVSTLENAGSATWDAFGAVVAQQRYGLGPSEVGALLTAGACASFAVSTLAFDRVSRAVGIVPTAVFGLALVGLGLVGVGAASTSLHAFVLAASLYQLGKPLYAPTLPTLLLRCVPPHRRGLAMGVDSIFNTLARAISPILLGALLHARGDTACFAVAGALVLSAAGLASLRGIQVNTSKRLAAASSTAPGSTSSSSF
ncbi:hypothetical protein CTAYLR_001081 [Chrysophaeum taylorii]|uniref:Major facilitator superfamily (MFS) profile domain-containing protein n=1 Tax=Chrysophaeum taylorii TaxID=2483200 RepID=A0AAD7XLP3_9STRA|nr:hypothetical protein CTAYLR_001081 [Chrysophaeum taylorii]